MSTKKINITNHPTSFWGGLSLLLCLFMIMQLFGCDECKNTSSTMECIGKSYKSAETEFKKGYDQK